MLYCFKMANKWREICDKLSYDRNLKVKWAFNYEFLFTCIAVIFNFNTVIEFTRLVYSWGGLFLIQYLILIITIGFPMIYVESILGQFSNCSPIYVYNICPAAVGFGIGIVIYSFITSLFHYVFILYSLNYAFFSCYVILPWSTCQSWWNSSSNCYIPGKKLLLPFCSERIGNSTVGVDCMKWATAAQEFWSRFILDSESDENVNFYNIKWIYLLFIILFWILTFVVSVKGISAIAKISWVLALSLSLIILVLSGFSLTLYGSSRGLAQGFAPKFDSIIKMNSWKEAAVHIIVSLTLNYGIMATYSSCNHFTQTSLHRDLIILCSVKLLISLCTCIFVFAITGNLALKLRMSMDELIPKDSWNLCFVLVPQALSHVIWPQLWTFLFFIYLSLLPFAFHFALIQVVLISIFDGAPQSQSYRKYICILYCVVGASVGFSFATHKGKNIYDFIKLFCLPSIPFPFLFAVGKIIVVAWIYGWRNFLHDVEFMLGLCHSWLLIICLSFVDPFAVFFLFIHCTTDFFIDIPTTVSRYSIGSQIFGSFLILVPVLPTLIGFVSDARKHRKYKESLLSGFEATHAWGPSNPIFYQDYYDWLREKPEYTSTKQIRHKRRHKRLTDDEIVRRRKAAVRRRLSVVTDSLIRLKNREVPSQVSEMQAEDSGVSSVSRSHTDV